MFVYSYPIKFYTILSMGKRMTDTELWDQDWFLDLPDNYKLLYQYIKDKCDHSGIWRVNKRKFSLVSRFPMFPDDFLEAVNQTKSGEPVYRIIPLDKHRWFLPFFISDEYGKHYQHKIGAHRGMLRLLVSNKIPLSQIQNFDFGEMSTLGYEELKEIAYGKTILPPSIPHASPPHDLREREQEMEREKEREINNINKELPEKSSLNGDGRGHSAPQQLPVPVDPKAADWEFQRKAFKGDQEWVYRMRQTFNLSEEQIDASLDEFLKWIEDSNDKKSARLLWRHYPNWYPKKEHYKRKTKEQQSKNKADGKNLENKQNYDNQESW